MLHALGDDSSGPTHLVVGARRHHGVDHLAWVVDAGDRQLPQGAGELNCGETRSESPVVLMLGQPCTMAVFSDLPGL